jgi:hypothetical protein
MPDKQFWSSVPGILTGVAALITAVGTIYLSLNRPQPEPNPATGGQPPRVGADVEGPSPTTGPPSAETDSRLAKAVSNWELTRETFSDSSSKWWVGSESDEGGAYELALVGGRLRWNTAFRKGWERQQWVPYGPVTDFYAAVDFILVQGSGNDVDVGLAFGGTGTTHYVFRVISNNTFDLTLFKDNVNDSVFRAIPIPTQVSFQRSNRVGLLVDNGHMAFYVNGKLLGEYPADAYKGGQVGLTVGANAAGMVVVDFGNFELRRRS